MTEKVITVKQQKAITALLSERTGRDAAKKAGVSEKTLYTWLADPAFRAALRSAEADIWGAVTRRLGAGQTLALDTLEKLIQAARHESTKLTACVSWLNMFVKYRDMKDIDERLTALEAAIHDKK
jgi:hypothetical protein